MKHAEGWFLLLLAPALIAGCLFANYIGFDDRAHVEHELLRPGVSLLDMFRATENSTYFPITLLSYRFDLWLANVFGTNNPAPIMRVDSLFLHAAAAFFLWRALLALGLGRWMSFFAAAAWLAHPTACESVAWVSERKNVLAAFFGFASLWAWFGARAAARPILTAALFTLAILSKPTAAGFLPVYIVYECLMPAPDPNTAPRRRWLPSVILFLGMAALIVALARVNFNKTETAYVQVAGGNHFNAALTNIPILVQYIHNALLPFSLSIFYYSPIVTSPADTHFILNLLILAALVAATFKLSPNPRRTLFLWGWFVGALGPALNIIPLPYLMQDRYGYFALPAILMLAAESISALYTQLVPNYSPSMPRLAAFAVPVVLALFTFMRSAVYANDYELFRDAVEKQPQSAFAQQFFGITLAETADKLDLAGQEKAETIASLRQESLKHLDACLKCPDFERLLEPGRVKVLVGVLNERLGNAQAALPALAEELKKPQKPYTRVIAFLSLARIRLQENKTDEAMKFVDDAVLSSPEQKASPEILYFKGTILEKAGRAAEARAIYRSIPEKNYAWERAQARLKQIGN